MDQRWAEWLTVVSTAGLIPIEIYELVKEFNAVKVVVLIVNVLIVIYLILRPSHTLVEAYERSLEEESLLQDIENRLACPSCQQRVQGDYLLCPNCLTQLKKQCAACSRVLLLKWSIPR